MDFHPYILRLVAQYNAVLVLFDIFYANIVNLETRQLAVCLCFSIEVE
jgi:hypothetical protein